MLLFLTVLHMTASLPVVTLVQVVQEITSCTQVIMHDIFQIPHTTACLTLMLSGKTGKLFPFPSADSLSFKLPLGDYFMSFSSFPPTECFQNPHHFKSVQETHYLLHLALFYAVMCVMVSFSLKFTVFHLYSCFSFLL